MLDKKTFIIGILSLSAIVLLVANILTPRTATANFQTIQDNDFSMVTATALGGGDALFLTDKRTGLMAVFIYNPNTHKLEPKVVEPVQNAFNKK